ncbi:MAG: endonuclease/exonuclease/phosphatase family protein [Clostridia bacterium]|nr:endonuclease/exonuclease/phosphatase family protein [Clostridia bacterium]
MLIMSNNIWKCDDNLPKWIERGGDCSAEVRVKGLLRVYRDLLPDVLGLQESSVKMANLLMAGLADCPDKNGGIARYELITGGDTPIIYRQDKLKLIESGFFRYSEEIPGLPCKYNNGETKSYCWGVFEDRETKAKVAVTSTHLWWQSADAVPGSREAREYQIRQAAAALEEVMERYGCPGVLMGDFNAAADSFCIAATKELGWRDAHDIAVGDRDETRGHHWCDRTWYGRRDDGGTFEHAIDHILLKNEKPGAVKYFRRMTEEWFDPISDHYPLYIELEL